MARGRPPKVFVRPLNPVEIAELDRRCRGAGKRTPALVQRRALVVLLSSERWSAAEIGRSVRAKPGWVRDVIHRFNREGLSSLRPRWRGGRPRVITETMRAEIRRIATTRPQLLKEPYTRWSLSKLRTYLLRAKVVPAISEERLREILAEEKVFIARTKSWKRSPDPDFDAKAERVERLYAELPSVVVCFDEHGPVQPIPKAGRGWATRGLPQRIRANYRKPHGVQFFFGGYDVGADQLFGCWSARKGAGPTLRFLRQIRRRYPRDRRIYVIQDNLSAHWTAEVTGWAEANNVELVPTPTYASWLNRIEAEFGAMVEFVFSNSDYRSHGEIQQATSAYLRRRNHEARKHFEARQREKAKRRALRARRRSLAA